MENQPERRNKSDFILQGFNEPQKVRPENLQQSRNNNCKIKENYMKVEEAL